MTRHDSLMVAPRLLLDYRAWIRVELQLDNGEYLRAELVMHDLGGRSLGHIYKGRDLQKDKLCAICGMRSMLDDMWQYWVNRGRA